MDFDNSYTVILVVLGLIAGAWLSAVRRHRSDASESRMRRMMVCCGVDQEAAKYADHLLKLDMQAARRRCRRCPDTRKCEHWLDGEAIAGNDFCPNAEQFSIAASRRARSAR